MKKENDSYNILYFETTDYFNNYYNLFIFLIYSYIFESSIKILEE